MRDVDVKQVAYRAAQSAGQAPEAGQAILNALVNLIHFELMQGNRVVMPELIALNYSDAGTLQTESLVTDENGEITPLEPVGKVASSVAVAADATVGTPGATVVMPRVLPPEMTPAAATAAPAVAAAVAKRILFVPHAQDTSTDVILQKLSGAGYAVSTVDPAAAIQTIEQVKPDLVLIDGNIANFLGLVHEIKVRPGLGITSVVTVYPEGADPNLVDGLKICDDEVIQEPYEVEELAALAGAELSRVGEERNFFEQEIHLQLRTAEEWIEQANDLIAQLVDGAGLEEEKAASLSVAFREAVDNAARHGNKNQENRIVDVIYLLDRQKVTVTVEDEGDGFDTELYLTRGIQGNAVAAARERNQAGRVGGLGIMLMLKCLDDLEYNSVGNLVKLTKYR